MAEHEWSHERPSSDPRLAAAWSCPFCSSRALEFSKMQNYIHCQNCGADGPMTRLSDRQDDLWRLTLDRWNRRPGG